MIRVTKTNRQKLDIGFDTSNYGVIRSLIIYDIHVIYAHLLDIYETLGCF